MKKIIAILLILIISLPAISHAQRWKKSRGEYVFGLGATNFFGDLGGADRPGTNGMRDMDFGATKPLLSVGYAYRYFQWLVVQSDLALGYLSGNDEFTNYGPRNNRGLHFRSSIVELSLKAQVGYTHERQGRRYVLRGARGMKNMSIGGYGFLGIGLFHFNPKAKDQTGRWVALQPLGTEGQGLYPTREKYKRLQVCIPVGLGARFMLTKEFTLGIEYGFRVTFTDYIDDVSMTYPNIDLLEKEKGPVAAYFSDPTGKKQKSGHYNSIRGNPSNDDSYLFAVVSLRYNIPYSHRFMGRAKF